MHVSVVLGGAILALLVCIWYLRSQVRKINEQWRERIRRTAGEYVSQALADATGFMLPPRLKFVEPKNVEDLKLGQACWIPVPVAYAKADAQGIVRSRARWLRLDELNASGVSARWQPGYVLVYCEGDDEFVTLRFGRGQGLPTQRAVIFDLPPSPETHQFKVRDLGSVSDVPLQLLLW